METYYRSSSAFDGKLGYPVMLINGIAWEVHLEIINLMKRIVENGN